jgi:hypothetical protein
MKLRFLACAAVAIAAAACAPATQTASNCAASASAPWNPAEGAALTIEASSSGPDCEHAVASFVIRGEDKSVLWAEIYPTEYVMVLAPAHDPAAMQTALNEWITYDNTTMQTTSALPEWPANASEPQNGEFPFYPEEGLDREAYEAIRARNAPLYCYVQGMESLACLAFGEGAVEKVGLQTFPG